MRAVSFRSRVGLLVLGLTWAMSDVAAAKPKESIDFEFFFLDQMQQPVNAKLYYKEPPNLEKASPLDALDRHSTEEKSRDKPLWNLRLIEKPDSRSLARVSDVHYDRDTGRISFRRQSRQCVEVQIQRSTAVVDEGKKEFERRYLYDNTGRYKHRIQFKGMVCPATAQQPQALRVTRRSHVLRYTLGRTWATPINPEVFVRGRRIKDTRASLDPRDPRVRELRIELEQPLAFVLPGHTAPESSDIEITVRADNRHAFQRRVPLETFLAFGWGVREQALELEFGPQTSADIAISGARNNSDTPVPIEAACVVGPFDGAPGKWSPCPYRDPNPGHAKQRAFKCDLKERGPRRFVRGSLAELAQSAVQQPTGARRVACGAGECQAGGTTPISGQALTAGKRSGRKPSNTDYDAASTRTAFCPLPPRGPVRLLVRARNFADTRQCLVQETRAGAACTVEDEFDAVSNLTVVVDRWEDVNFNQLAARLLYVKPRVTILAGDKEIEPQQEYQFRSPADFQTTEASVCLDTPRPKAATVNPKNGKSCQLLAPALQGAQAKVKHAWARWGWELAGVGQYQEGSEGWTAVGGLLLSIDFSPVASRFAFVVNGGLAGGKLQSRRPVSVTRTRGVGTAIVRGFLGGGLRAWLHFGRRFPSIGFETMLQWSPFFALARELRDGEGAALASFTLNAGPMLRMRLRKAATDSIKVGIGFLWTREGWPSYEFDPFASQTKPFATATDLLGARLAIAFGCLGRCAARTAHAQ